MTTTFDRFQQLYTEGHRTPCVELFEDQRLRANDGSAPVHFRPAAVLIALTEREMPGMLLTHRPSNMRAHAGEIAFPGGGIDHGETPVEAALREANEELGIDPAEVRVIGESDIYNTYSGYAITPVLAVVPPDLDIRPNPVEVAQWFEAPVDFVLDRANQGERSVFWKGAHRSFNEIVWQDHKIWGITAALIVNLSRRLKWYD